MFDRGLTVLRIRGIPIKLHISLLIFLPYVAFAAATQFSTLAASVGVPRESLNLPPIAWGAVLAVGLFIAILAHELAHALVALRDGVRVRSITLMMLGGVTQMEEDDPKHEAWMAFAGPLMSFAIAIVSYFAYRLLPGDSEIRVALLAFAATNALLGVFNLLPAFPMDGGRVLRGLLRGRLGHDRATRVATSLGKIMAVAFGLFGLLSYNFILVLIAVFVYMGASAEQVRFSARDAVRGIPITALMTDRVGVARADEPATAVAERLLHDNLAAARVIDDTGELAVVTGWDLARAMERDGPAATAGTAVPARTPRVHAGEDATQAMTALFSGEASVVAVLDDSDDLIGVVTQAEMQRALVLMGLVRGRPS